MVSVYFLLNNKLIELSIYLFLISYLFFSFIDFLSLFFFLRLFIYLFVYYALFYVIVLPDDNGNLLNNCWIVLLDMAMSNCDCD